MSPSTVASIVGSGLARLAGTAAAFRDEESGAALIEYTILLSVVAGGMLGLMLVVSALVQQSFESAATELRNTPNCEAGQKKGNKWC